MVRYLHKNGKRQATITTFRWSHDPYYIACHRKGHERVIIVKFPPYVTDILQPLDVTCFGPLKRRWEQLLQERVNLFAAKSQLSKEDFVNQLCKIWKDGMKESNIVNGFSSTGEGEQCLKFKILWCRVLWYM